MERTKTVSYLDRRTERAETIGRACSRTAWEQEEAIAGDGISAADKTREFNAREAKTHGRDEAQTPEGPRGLQSKS